MKERTFIIFGGSGFLGQHLINELILSYPNTTIKSLDLKPHPMPYCTFEDDSRIEQLYGKDISQPQTYEEDLNDNVDCLFNLVGSISFRKKDRKKMYTVNVDGVRKLVSTAIRKGIKKIVHVSSVASIGFTNNPDIPADENLNCDWTKHKKSHYMYTKHLGEEILLGHKEEFEKIVIVNPGVMYGPGDLYNTISLFRNLFKGRVAFYTPGGTGIVDVRDAADGLVLAYQKGKTGERYILNSHNLRFQKIMRLAAYHLQVRPPEKSAPKLGKYPLMVLFKIIESLPVKNPPITRELFELGYKFRFYSSKKAEDDLGWKSSIPLDQTFSDAVRWYREKGLL